MKVRVVITDDDGNSYEGEAMLVASSAARSRSKASEKKPLAAAPGRPSPDFSLPLRAFVKRHAKGLGGAQKFTVLLAKLSGGKPGTTVSLAELEKAWNRMTGPMGGKFNPAYTTRAKENGWVDTPKTGSYALLSTWIGALGE